MRFIVFGAGAIGGVAGGRLAQHGHDVVLIARGEHAAVMHADGLRIESPDDVVTVRVPVVRTPSEIEWRPGDAVLLAVKSQDTHAALEAVRDVAPADTPIVCMQNGVDNERAALRLFPHVFAVCVMCPAAHPRPGAVQAYSSPVSGIFDIGRYPYGVDDIADTIAAAFGRSSIVSEARPDIMRWKYTKLLLNLVNAVDALFAHGGSASRVAALARDEGAACLRAAGIDFASTEEDAERRGDLLKARAIPGEERAGSSSRQSLAKGAGTIETDALNGEIVLLGRLHGVPTPINAALQVLAHQAATSRTPPGSYSADDFLRTFAG